MNYQTFNPHNDLSAFVKCYWTLDAPADIKPEKQQIVPDGCMEMIFHFGDNFRQYLDDGSSIIQPKCFVFGQITTALAIEPTGKTDIFAVRFHPDGFSPFALSSINKMENRAVPLDELFGKSGDQLEKEMLSCQTIKSKIKTVEEFLLARLISPEAIDRIAKSTVETILQVSGQLSIDELSDHLQINRRQLERKFSSAIGLSPKQLSKIIRLQATLKMLANNQFTSLTAAAHNGEYYDQAHFIKDFKEFTGVSPKKFYSNNLKMSLLFIGEE